MAEIRRSRPSSQGGGVRAVRSGVATRSSRRIISRPGKVPRWAYVALLAGPGAGILILLAINLFRGSEEPVDAPKDLNAEIGALEVQVRDLTMGCREVMQLLQDEDPSAKARLTALQAQMTTWVESWDRLFESLKVNGELPDEYKGYLRSRTRVQQLIIDLEKSTGF